MPIKTMACVLAMLAGVSFWYTCPATANPDSAAKTVETTDRFHLKVLRFRVVTTGTVNSFASSNISRDVFRFIIFGIALQDRDQLSFTISGPDGTVDLGHPFFEGDDAFVELRRRKGVNDNGVLGAAPYRFPNFRMQFNPNKKRLNFFSGKGIAQATPFLSAATGITPNVPIDLTVHVRRPGDADFDFTYAGQYSVRHSQTRQEQLQVYSAR